MTKLVRSRFWILASFLFCVHGPSINKRKRTWSISSHLDLTYVQKCAQYQNWQNNKISPAIWQFWQIWRVGSSLYVLRAYGLPIIVSGFFFLAMCFLKPGNFLCGRCFANLSCELVVSRKSRTVWGTYRVLHLFAFIYFELLRSATFQSSLFSFFVLELRAL